MDKKDKIKFLYDLVSIVFLFGGFISIIESIFFESYTYFAYFAFISISFWTTIVIIGFIKNVDMF